MADRSRAGRVTSAAYTPKSATTAKPTSRRRAVGQGEGRESNQDFMKGFSNALRSLCPGPFAAAQRQRAGSTKRPVRNRTVEFSCQEDLRPSFAGVSHVPGFSILDSCRAGVKPVCFPAPSWFGRTIKRARQAVPHRQGGRAAGNCHNLGIKRNSMQKGRIGANLVCLMTNRQLRRRGLMLPEKKEPASSGLQLGMLVRASRSLVKIVMPAESTCATLFIRRITFLEGSNLPSYEKSRFSNIPVTNWVVMG